MKKYLKNMHDKTNFWNLFIGIIIGFGVGVYSLNALIPNASESIRMYHMDKESREQEGMMRMNHTMSGMNSYTSPSITTEKQFVEEMIKHHQAAVTMAQQVLTLSPRDEVKKLANDIISAQSAEIKMMQSWLTNWK